MIQKHLPHDHGQTIEQELEHMPRVENFQTVADIFKQLGDGSRIRIFCGNPLQKEGANLSEQALPAVEQ